MYAIAALDAMHWQMVQFDRDRLEAMAPEERAAELRRRMLKRLQQKDERMVRRLARHRAAIWKRRWGLAGGWFLFLCGLPLAVFIVTECWKLALHAVTG